MFVFCSLYVYYVLLYYFVPKTYNCRAHYSYTFLFFCLVVLELCPCNTHSTHPFTLHTQHNIFTHITYKILTHKIITHLSFKLLNFYVPRPAVIIILPILFIPIDMLLPHTIIYHLESCFSDFYSNLLLADRRPCLNNFFISKSKLVSDSVFGDVCILLFYTDSFIVSNGFNS